MTRSTSGPSPPPPPTGASTTPAPPTRCGTLGGVWLAWDGAAAVHRCGCGLCSAHRHHALPALHSPCPAQDDDTGGAAPAGADGGGLANADAERTLLRVKQKLEGVEAGGCLQGAQEGSRGGGSSCSRGSSIQPLLCQLCLPACPLCRPKRLPLPHRAGEGEARGVEGQVQQLLADAQDPDKLCRMYIGWQSWV